MHFVRQDLQDRLDFFVLSQIPPARHRLRLQARRAGMNLRNTNPPAAEGNQLVPMGSLYFRLTSTPLGPKLIRRPVSF